MKCYDGFNGRIVCFFMLSSIVIAVHFGPCPTHVYDFLSLQMGGKAVYYPRGKLNGRILSGFETL